jgi:tetratricopeptide (TPR) repeat protein
VAAAGNGCAFNLRLALVAAANDGANIDLDQAARSSGLLTRWRIIGPFGQYNNVDFERHWPPESDKLLRAQYPYQPEAAVPVSERKATQPSHASPIPTLSAEQFWFRDGMIALPEYFGPSGVFYAAAELEVPNKGQEQIDVLSSGSYEVFIDGKSSLLHDSRFVAGSNHDSGAIVLTAGKHHVLVKFTADAAPLSIAIHPQFSVLSRHKSALPQSAQDYVKALLQYFRGNLIKMESLLHSGRIHNAGYANYLQALLYSAAEEHSPRADAAWKSIAMAQPSALLARLKSAENAIERGQAEIIRPEVMGILAERPQSETALQLAFGISRSNQVDAPALLRRLLELHPSCMRLAEAVKFYNAAAEQDKAGKIEQQLARCAPDSLEYAQLLSESGRHSAAAAYLQELITRNPLHRAARRFLIKQLLLDNQTDAAKLQAKQLRDIAVNATSYARLAEDPAVIQDSTSQRAEDFKDGDEFYVPYRRDGLEIVRGAAQRSFSGGAAVILLSDKTILLHPSGSVAIYVHRITRPLNKEGISRYGEVTLPRGADLLELRTVKSSGEIIEPELPQQKPTISMPALEPGDAIEEEYVTHYSELGQAPENAASHSFGSFAAPILHSRFVLLSPADDKANIQVREQSGPPQPLVGKSNGSIVRIWERANIAQTITEPFLPGANLLPTVVVVRAEKTRDRLRDELVEATRAGIRVNEAWAELNLPQMTSELEEAKQIYRYLGSKIDSTGEGWAGNSAEDTLATGQGSRTMALLALARIAGLKAGLLLARKVDHTCGKDHDLSCYTEPLVRFGFANGETVDVDAESDDSAFGDLSPLLEPKDALFIPLLADDEKKPELVALMSHPTDDKSAAEGDLSFHEGDLVANIQVQLGSARGQAVRSTLRNAGEPERQSFFEQLAMRIFPGATAVSGTAMNENNPEQPLKLSLRCTAPQFINRQSGILEIDQLAPALGLATLYARDATRKFPLYIESLFFESTVFHLHLPAGINLRSLPSDFTGKTEFGEYTLRFSRSTRQVDIHRAFHIPVQVVAPEKYPAFVKFAFAIDEAERQHILLEVVKDSAGVMKNGLRPSSKN